MARELTIHRRDLAVIARVLGLVRACIDAQPGDALADGGAGLAVTWGELRAHVAGAHGLARQVLDSPRDHVRPINRRR